MVKDKKFTEEVMRRLREGMGDRFRIIPGECEKNNGIRLSGVVILENEGTIAPMIYLDGYYQQYQAGMTMDEIVEDIEAVYRGTSSQPQGKSMDIQDFEKVKNRICFKLINREWNRELLEKVPYVSFMNLAVVFYLYLDDSKSGQLTAMIRNNHMKCWGITVQELFQLARENTPQWLPPEFRSMKDVMKEILMEHISAELDRVDVCELLCSLLEEDMMPLYVLSNKSGLNGAAAMLYPGALKQAAEEIGSDLVIFPSSVNEVILTAYKEGMDLYELAEMVKGINQTDIPPEDVLGDGVYVYRRESEVICMER